MAILISNFEFRRMKCDISVILFSRFVTMGSIQDAEKAIRDLDKFRIDAFMLSVKVAMSDEEKMRRQQERKVCCLLWY